MQLNLTDYEARLLESRLRGRTVSFSDADHLMIQEIADRLLQSEVHHRVRRETDEYACSCGARWSYDDVDGHP